MAAADTKRCVVAYATRDHQCLWTVDLPGSATIADALSIARGLATSAPEEVPWETAPVGVYGEIRDRQDVPADGDRIELYRPLQSDPRERRRERVRKDRRKP
jgi:hypothetical protein